MIVLCSIDSSRQRPRLQAKTISQTSSLVPPTSPRLQDSRLNSGFSGGAGAQAGAAATGSGAARTFYLMRRRYRGRHSVLSRLGSLSGGGRCGGGNPLRMGFSLLF